MNLARGMRFIKLRRVGSSTPYQLPRAFLTYE